MTRVDWYDLPYSVRCAVEAECGLVVGVTTPDGGRNANLIVVLEVQDGRQVFVKGVQADTAEAAGFRREAALNPALPAVAPRLLWQVEVDGWLMLGFEYIPGRHADLSLGSADLILVADAVSAIARHRAPIPTPELPALADKITRISAWTRLGSDPPSNLDPWARANLDRFADADECAAEWAAGDSLAHTDLHAHNILVNDAAHVVDWSWAHRAAPWIDAAYLVIRLIQNGHGPAQAEQWAATTECWHTATPVALDSFAVGTFGIWEFLRLARPHPVREAATAAARRWAQHRLDEQS
ncbi:phosphotransferase family protein [Nocardioides speluncae]|uniref:phosphotransferase family protein n=1 Tax=Nocardioides speluncae TaxID=2670337 RepID=UPI0013798DB7|nr:phosphotransferase [Nocardioides speluncae]